MTEHAARIHLKPFGGSITLDGLDLAPYCQSINLFSDASTGTTLTLDIPLRTADIDGPVKAEVDATTAAALVALGWTPPAKDVVVAIGISGHVEPEGMLKVMASDLGR